jgi:hypothetical protein
LKLPVSEPFLVSIFVVGRTRVAPSARARWRPPGSFDSGNRPRAMLDELPAGSSAREGARARHGGPRWHVPMVRVRGHRYLQSHVRARRRRGSRRRKPDQPGMRRPS